MKSDLYSNQKYDIMIKRKTLTISIKIVHNPGYIGVLDMSISVYVQVVKKDHTFQRRAQAALLPVQKKLITG